MSISLLSSANESIHFEDDKNIKLDSCKIVVSVDFLFMGPDMSADILPNN